MGFSHLNHHLGDSAFLPGFQFLPVTIRRAFLTCLLHTTVLPRVHHATIFTHCTHPPIPPFCGVLHHCALPLHWILPAIGVLPGGVAEATTTTQDTIAALYHIHTYHLPVYLPSPSGFCTFCYCSPTCSPMPIQEAGGYLPSHSGHFCLQS